jgi:hypothetical protein
MRRDRPRIFATNARMKDGLFENSWSIRGWSLGVALPELQVKSGEELGPFLGPLRGLIPSILDETFQGEL